MLQMRSLLCLLVLGVTLGPTHAERDVNHAELLAAKVRSSGQLTRLGGSRVAGWPHPIRTLATPRPLLPRPLSCLARQRAQQLYAWIVRCLAPSRP